MLTKYKLIIKTIFIAIIVGLATAAVLPRGPDLRIGKYFKEIRVHQGLDLAGGTRLVYELDLQKIQPEDRSSAIQGVITVINNRINSLGASEPIIQTTKIGDKQAVAVELPGIKDVNEAIELIGQTAQLEFSEPVIPGSGEEGSDGPVPGFKKTGLTGANLIRASVEYQNHPSNQLTQGQPVVSLIFDSEGTKKFREITQQNLNKPVAISLDDRIISAPTVQTVIENGNAIITGLEGIQEAKRLAIQLNSGALPVSINLVSQNTIGATLGQESVERSLVASLLAILIVILYMALYYQGRGAIASTALLIYVAIVAALFKTIPVTITLAGIAGLVLSIGAAVDANILIFERMKEELRQGRSLSSSIDEGFRRAWSSIRDSNISSLITAAILFYFGTGLVRGFALTLSIGILVSMFTAITVSKTLLQLILKNK